MSTGRQTVKTRSQKQAEKEEKKSKQMKENQNNMKNKKGTVEKYIEEDTTLKAIKTNRDNKLEKWSDIKDVEAKIKILETKYKKTTIKEKKRQIQGLIDSYQKQMKKLILEDANTKKKRNVEKEIIIIDDDDAVKEDMSVISGVTQNTLATKIRNEMSQNEEIERKKNTGNTTKLETLGKTRKANTKQIENKNDDEENMQNRSESSASDGSQNGSLISGVTKEEAKGKKGEQLIENESIEIDEGENESVISGVTKDDTVLNRRETENEEEDSIDDENISVISGVTFKSTNVKLKEGKGEDDGGSTEMMMNRVTNPYGKRKEANSLNNNRREIVTPDQSNKPQSDETTKRQGYAEVVKDLDRDMEMTTPKSTNSTNGGGMRKCNYIRIRFQFVGKYSKQTKNAKLRDVLYHTMKCAKEIDVNAALMPWSDKHGARTLNGIEIKLQNEVDIPKYIDMGSQSEMNITAGRIYYNNGIRIKTELDVYDFVEGWNNKQYDKTQGSPFQEEWKPVKRSEMQYSDTAYPIGYFVATSERGDYDTISNEIAKEEQYKVELSFQNVYQNGVTSKIWKMATERATEVYTNTTSKAHRQLKFSLAPSALTVFTRNEKDIGELREKFMIKYGELENGEWPTMMDGSKMDLFQ